MPGSILVLGNYRQTLTVVRSLARAGYRPVVTPDRIVFVQRSRATAEIWRAPPLTDEAQYLAALNALLATRGDLRWVFPVGENQIRLILRVRTSLPASTMPVMADAAVIPLCLDKAALYAEAAAAGVPCAAHQVALDYEGLLGAARQLGYPVVVKPPSSLRAIQGRKALILRDDAETRQRLGGWSGAGHEALLVQRFVAGIRHNCHFLAHEGTLLAYFEHTVLRTDRLDDTGFGVDNITVAPSPILRDSCRQLLGRLHYSGIGCAQFLVDASAGAAALLEINPRLDANCAVPYHCGYDFPALALDYARFQRGELSSPPSMELPYRARRRVDWLTGDLSGLWQAVRHRQVGWGEGARWLVRSVGSLVRAHHHVTWSPSDPLPSLYRAASMMLAPLRAWRPSAATR